VLLAPLLVFGLVLLIPATLLIVLASPLFGVAGMTTLIALAPDAEHPRGGHGRPNAADAAGYAGL
jgi:hypothetical protein